MRGKGYIMLYIYTFVHTCQAHVCGLLFCACEESVVCPELVLFYLICIALDDLPLIVAFLFTLILGIEVGTQVHLYDCRCDVHKCRHTVYARTCNTATAKVHV